MTPPQSPQSFFYLILFEKTLNPQRWFDLARTSSSALCGAPDNEQRTQEPHRQYYNRKSTRVPRGGDVVLGGGGGMGRIERLVGREHAATVSARMHREAIRRMFRPRRSHQQVANTPRNTPAHVSSYHLLPLTRTRLCVPSHFLYMAI